MLKHLINSKPRIAILGTYLALYDTAFPGYRERVRAFAESISQSLSNQVDIEMLGICVDESSAAAFLAEAEKSSVDALVLLSLGYTNSLSVAGPLAATSLPLVFFNTQEAETVSPCFSDLDLRWNHGMQGVQDLAAVLTRRGKPFTMATGLLSKSDTRLRLLDQLAVLRAQRELRSARVALLGAPMPGMGDSEYDHDRMREVFGVESIHLDPALLAEAASRATEDEIHESMRFDREHFEIAPDVSEPVHRCSARLEIGLRRLVEEHALAGLTLSFDTIAKTPGIESIPFFGIVKLMGEGMAYGGEGDLFVTAAGAIAGRLCQEVCFTEIYTMDFVNNAVLNSHMAECNFRFARKDRKPKLFARQFSLADSAPFLLAHFALEPGPATLFDLAVTADGGFRFILSECEVMDWPASLELDRPNFKLRFARDIRDVMDEYSLLGGGHHLNLVYGRQARLFQMLAKLCGVPCESI